MTKNYKNVYEAIAGITTKTFGKHDRSVRGNVAQLLFRAEAAARGFVPCSPAWNLPVDHILIDYSEHHRIVRIEIKQSLQFEVVQTQKHGDIVKYTVELRRSQGPGGKEGSKKGKDRVHEYHKSIDVFAILLPEHACWYLIPARELSGRSSVSLAPGIKTYQFAQYQDAWRILKDEEHALSKKPVGTQTKQTQ